MRKARITGQSPRHVWKRYGSVTDQIDRCARCGALFSYRGCDTEWLKDHPEDDQKER